jgi:hypothetical protein
LNCFTDLILLIVLFLSKTEGVVIAEPFRNRTPSINSPSNEVFVYSFERPKVHRTPYFQGFHDFFTLQIFGPRNVLQNPPQGEREASLAGRQFADAVAHPAFA